MSHVSPATEATKELACELIYSGFYELEAIKARGTGWSDELIDDLPERDLYHSFYSTGIDHIKAAFQLHISNDQLDLIRIKAFTLMENIDQKSNLAPKGFVTLGKLSPEQLAELSTLVMQPNYDADALSTRFNIKPQNVYLHRSNLRKKAKADALAAQPKPAYEAPKPTKEAKPAYRPDPLTITHKKRGPKRKIKEASKVNETATEEPFFISHIPHYPSMGWVEYALAASLWVLIALTVYRLVTNT